MSSIRIKYEPLRELLRKGEVSVLGMLQALTDHIQAQNADHIALQYLKSAEEAYMNDRPDAILKTRTIEYYRMWDDKTWDTEFIEIPADTDDDDISFAVRVAADVIKWGEDGPPVFVGVYHIPDENYVLSDTCTGCMGPLDTAGDCPNQSCSS